MHPILTVLEWHGSRVAIGSYGACLTLALLVGAGLCVRSSLRAGLDEGAMIASIAGAIGCGFIGAYLASLLGLWVELGSLAAALEHPGIMFYGGAIFGSLGFALFARRHQLPVARAFDQTVPGLPVAHAIGRIGCLFGGCCYGAPSRTPWAIRYSDALAPAAHPSVARHPWPLYEALALLALAALFASPDRFALRPGQRAASYVALYAAVRCGLEPLRGDTDRGLFWNGSYSIAQLIAIATGTLALLFLSIRARRPLCPRSLEV